MSDDEYLSRYEWEQRRYVARYAPRRLVDRIDPGEAYLNQGRWAWVDDGSRAAQRWSHYASGYTRLLVMRPDGTWRPWDWKSKIAGVWRAAPG